MQLCPALHDIPSPHQNLLQITEMLDFADQLRRSHQLAVVRTEELLLMVLLSLSPSSPPLLTLLGRC